MTDRFDDLAATLVNDIVSLSGGPLASREDAMKLVGDALRVTSQMAAQNEREACAKVADAHQCWGRDCECFEGIASAIRGRK